MTRRAASLGPPAAVAAAALCLVAAVLFLVLPVVALVHEAPLRRLPELARTGAVRDALRVTLVTNALANALLLAVGTPAAYLLATRRFPGRSVLLTLLELPLVLPPAVAGLGLLAAFGQAGLLGHRLAGWGVVLPFTQAAVTLAVLFVAAPYYVRGAVAAFAGVDQTLVAAARSLGASPTRAFVRIALPLAAGGLAAGWALAFARGVGEFGATILFAGSVAGQTQTLPLAVYEELDVRLDVALAVGVLLVALSAVVLLAAKLVAAWARPSSAPAPAVTATTTTA